MRRTEERDFLLLLEAGKQKTKPSTNAHRGRRLRTSQYAVERGHQLALLGDVWVALISSSHSIRRKLHVLTEAARGACIAKQPFSAANAHAAVSPFLVTSSLDS